VSYWPQLEALRNGVDIVVATVGRVIDHLENKESPLSMADVQVAVLDEADEMLKMGFAEEVERILNLIALQPGEGRQTLLFSATQPPWVDKTARDMMRRPLVLDTVGSGAQQAATTTIHRAILVPKRAAYREALLEDIITSELAAAEGTSATSRVIVFTETKRECDEIAGGAAFKALSAQVR
jgi:ATP-dependent RNA helicase DDX21